MTKCQFRRTSRDTDVASTAGALLSESEASELFGEYIDEDSQTVHHVSILSLLLRLSSLDCLSFTCAESGF